MEQTQVIDWASDEQKELFERGPAPTLASGGYGSAKTTGGIYKLLYLADRFPGYRAAIIRRRYTELWKTTLQSFFAILPPDSWARRNDQAGELVLKNGSRFDFIYLEKADAATVLKGIELNAALVDQAEEMPEETFDLLKSRLGRWRKVQLPDDMLKSYEDQGKPWPWMDDAGTKLAPSFLLLTANPDTELHWLWKRFHPNSQEWRDDWRLKGYKMINFRSDKNKFLSRETLADLMSHDESWVRRYVYGEWGRPEGALFDVSPKSIVEPTPELVERLTRECSLYRVLDHGFSAPTACVWYAVDREQNVWAYREYYRISDQISEHRAAITSLSGNEQYRASMADSSIFNKEHAKGGGKWRVSDEYSDKKLYAPETAIWWSPVDKNEMPSRHRIKEYLKVDPKRKHPVTGEMGSPRLFFLTKTDSYPNGCDNVITETKSAKLTKVGLVNDRPVFNDERDETVPDHAYDTLRYMLMSRPTPNAERQKVASIHTFEGYDKFSRRERIRRDQIRDLDK